MITKAMTHEDCFLQVMEEDVDVEPHHFSIMLYDIGVVSSRFMVAQKTMRVMSSEKCPKTVCVYFAATV